MFPADKSDSANIKLVDFGLIALVSGEVISDVSHDLTGRSATLQLCKRLKHLRLSAALP